VGVIQRSTSDSSGQIAGTSQWFPRSNDFSRIQPVPLTGQGPFLGAFVDWALRLKARHARWADVPDLALVLLRRLGQLPLRIHRSWRSFHTRFDPHFALSLVGAPAAGQVERSVVERVLIYSFTRFARRYARPQDPARSAALGSRVARYRPLSRPVAPFVAPTMLLARPREQLQLSTLIHRPPTIRRESEVAEIARRLAERGLRIPVAPPPPAPMALRRGIHRGNVQS
jgi:hypothetical protein